jgi:hypothetical protein
MEVVVLNPNKNNKGLAIMSKNALKQTAYAVSLTIIYGLTISQANLLF